MSDQTSNDELARGTGFLMRFRLPLMAALLLNCWLLGRIPWNQLQAAKGSSPAVAPSNPGPRTASHTVATAGGPKESSPSQANPGTSKGSADAAATAASGSTASSQPGRPASPTNRIPSATRPGSATGGRGATAAGPINPARPVAIPDLSGETLEDPTDTAAAGSVSPVTSVPSLVVRVPGAGTGEPGTGNVIDLNAEAQPRGSRLGNRLADAGRFVGWLSQGVSSPSTRDPFASSTSSTRTPAAQAIDVTASHPAHTASDGPSDSNQLTLRNPADSGGTIWFLVNGGAEKLEPGQQRVFSGEPEFLVEFHRGGELGDLVLVLPPGSYEFHVSPAGWDLAGR